jgi:hypothetical protein
MAEHDDGSWKTSTRGEQAWKETKERIATRNAEVSKSGKQERESYDRERATVRNTAAVKRDAKLQKRRTA